MNDLREGRRIRLVRCTDPYTHMAPGSLGTVRFIDGTGTVHVDWDSGARIGLIPNEDSWEVLD